MKYLYHVAVSPGIRYECTGESALQFHKGDRVVIKCDRYHDCGTIVFCDESQPADEGALADRLVQQTRGRKVQGQRPPSVVRVVAASDLARLQENDVKEQSLCRIAHERISLHRLPMKLINGHCTFDRSLVVFQFTAEGRVDFRELVRDLAHSLHMRVELRQIGVRDETAIQGGLGCCGRPFCCAAFLRDFVSINVKMAKEQGLSLNPSNISGACGRLKCCLRYEAEGYKEMRRHLPRNGAPCDTPDGLGKVLDSNALTQRIKVRLEGEAGRVVDYPVADVRVRAPKPPPGRSEPEPPEPPEENGEAVREIVADSEPDTASGGADGDGR